MYEMVALSAQSPSTVRVFLSALKRFYFSVLFAGEYPHAHPLTKPVVHLLQEVDQEDTDVHRSRPKMPPESGIEEPQRKRLCKTIGIDLNIHWLRHWHVSQMIQKVVKIRPRSTRQAPSKDQIQQVLQDVLMGSESPPLSLFAIARRLRCDVHLLTQYDRQACQAISAQYRAYVQARKEARMQHYREEIRRGALSLHAQDISVTKKHVEPLLTKSGYLRSPELRAFLSEVRRELEGKI